MAGDRRPDRCFRPGYLFAGVFSHLHPVSLRISRTHLPSPSMLCPAQRSHASPGFSPRPRAAGAPVAHPFETAFPVAMCTLANRPRSRRPLGTTWSVSSSASSEAQGQPPSVHRSGAIAMRTVSHGLSGRTSSWEFEGGTAEQLLSAGKTRDVR